MTSSAFWLSVLCPGMKKYLRSVALLLAGTVALGPLHPVEGQEAIPAAATISSVSTSGRSEHTISLIPPGTIRIDGVLDEPAWQEATRIELPWEVDPGNNTPANVSTTCYTTYDARHLYFACHARDGSPGGIRAWFTDRDQIGNHDRILLGIDPFNDSRRGFLFAISALGVQLDAVWQQESADVTWDAIWNSAGRIVDDGYVVEGAVPFKSLRFPAGTEEQTWGVWFERRRPRSNNERYMSMPWDRDNACLICQSALLHGFQGIAPGRNLEITPTFTGTRTDVRTGEGGSLDAGPLDREFGLDARVGITPALTLNATVNPDFSQVEADVAQLNVNQRFALFFPERRPFFLEGADLFQTPIQAVFTRTIASPEFGTKVSGKSGSSAYGLLVAKDRETNLIFPGPQGSSGTTLDQAATTMIGRYRRDIGTSSTAGVLYTGREGDGYHNRVVGADLLARPRGWLTARLQVLRSSTSYPEAVGTDQNTEGTFAGTAVQGRIDAVTRSWQVRSLFGQRSPGFRADAGFVPDVGKRDVSVWGGPTFWANDQSWFTVINARVGAWHDEEWNGDLLVEGVWASLNYNGPGQSDAYVTPNVWHERFQGVEYDITRTWFGGSIRPTGTFGLGVDGNVGGAIDFTNNQPARTLQLEPWLDLRLGRHLETRLSHVHQRLRRDGDPIFTANLSQARLVYSASTRALARIIVQYQQVDRNPDRFLNPVNRTDQSLLTSLLLSYKVNPLTVVFLGYGDNWSGETTVDRRSSPLERTDRTFFVKLGYAWRP